MGLGLNIASATARGISRRKVRGNARRNPGRSTSADWMIPPPSLRWPNTSAGCYTYGGSLRCEPSQWRRRGVRDDEILPATLPGVGSGGIRDVDVRYGR